MNYSQNQEQQHIVSYFKGLPGHLLDIGANDGQTFSNSRYLLEHLNWSGVLVEPAPTPFKKLKKLYKGNDLVKCVNAAMAAEVGRIDFWDMGEHVGNGDTSLLSTALPSEMIRWKGTPFKKTTVKAITYKEVEDVYDFISIDCEGLDLIVLHQIDLKHTNLVCVEHNGNKTVKNHIIDYCARFNITRIIYDCLENIIIGR